MTTAGSAPSSRPGTLVGRLAGSTQGTGEHYWAPDYCCVDEPDRLVGMRAV
jgi:hypothetical protein